MTDLASRLRDGLASHYRIERELGAGGMATVFLATDLKHQRQVAIKVLRADISGSLGSERFLREIRIAARLTHPNILPLHDSGEVNGILYYVMPYVEGKSLRDILNEQRQLPVETALRITGEVSDALTHAHSKGVVHRDIKPGNILVEDEHAVVCDFGIAKAIAKAADEDTISKHGIAIGTPAYMSPEQATGEGHIDGRSDVYALGCVLYEMLIGEPPFTGPTSVAVLARHAAVAPPSLRAVRTSLPLWLEKAVHRALSKNPADRFQSAAEFKKALIAPASESPPEQNRRRLVIPLVAAGGIAIIAALVFALNRPSSQATLVAKRVVVAPFANRTGEPALDQIGIMAADWITQGLQETGVVDVIPTPTAIQSARYVDQLALDARGASSGARSDPIRMLADETNAGTVISGAYYREGDHLQFQVQVSDVANGRLLTAPEPVIAITDSASMAIAELRTRLMGSLASSFDSRLKGFAGEARQPPRYDAYREYSLGIESYVSEKYEEALPHFYRAMELDSTFAAAILFASLNSSNLGRYSLADSLLRKVQPFRSRLSEYDRNWLDYRVALMRGDRTRALSAIRLSAAAAPGSKAMYNLGIEALENGYIDESYRAFAQLVPERGPMRGWMPYWDAFASVNHLRGEHRSELEIARDARRHYPGRQMPLAIEARAVAALGKTGEISRLVQEAELIRQDPSGWSANAVIREAAEELRAHGHGPAATKLFRHLLAANSELRGRNPSETDHFAQAEILYALGEFAEASKIADSLLGKSPNDLRYLGLAGRASARLGNRTKALEISDRLRRANPAYVYGLHTQQRAFIAAVLNDRQQAISLLQQALAEGRPFDLWLHRHQDLEGLKGFEPFLELGRGRS